MSFLHPFRLWHRSLLLQNPIVCILIYLYKLRHFVIRLSFIDFTGVGYQPFTFVFATTLAARHKTVPQDAMIERGTVRFIDFSQRSFFLRRL